MVTNVKREVLPIIAHINPITSEKQSVKNHCDNTAKVSCSFGQAVGLSNIAFLAGILHDCGKLTNQFNEYIEKVSKNKDHARKGEVTHSTTGAILVYERYFKGDYFQQLTAQLLIVAIYSHHGQYDIINLEGKDIFSLKIQKKGEICYEEAINNFLMEVLSLEELDALFEKAVNEVTEIYDAINKITENYIDIKERKQAMDYYAACLQRILLSILIDADRMDTASFCGNRVITLEAASSNQMLWKELCNTLELELGKLDNTSSLSAYRNDISKECQEFAQHNYGIYKLMVPTGGGKTLSSMRYALSHAKLYNKKHIFYVAPYLSIVDQNADVIRRVLHNDNVILEHHSNIINEPNYEEGTNQWEQLCENWDSPIILTTMVQMLNTMFDGRTQCVRRMHNLANSIIIFDEIQNLPSKCYHLFNMMVNFLSYVCRSTVILCSATQPILDDKIKHKILFKHPTNIIDDIDNLFNKFQRVEVIDKTQEGNLDTDNIAHFIIEQIGEWESVLAIMNTRRTAQNLYKQLREQLQNCDIKIFILTTHLCPKHRLDIIDEIKRLLGKGKVICISTSLIEAGVDISFQCVIRSLAGLDNIAQAAGRCNRNCEVAKGKVYVIKSKDEDLSRLPEIKRNQNAVYPIINTFHSDPEYFANDLLSLKALDKYYKRFLVHVENDINYKIPEKNANIFDLLSTNEAGTKAYITNTREYPKLPMNQAYKTAGEVFEVIINHTIGVIVPYNDEGKEIISELNSNPHAKNNIRECLRRAQVYTVNLYQHEFDQLFMLGGIYQIEDNNFFILVDGFYSIDVGLTMGTEIEFLSI